MSKAGIAYELYRPARIYFQRRHVLTKGLYYLFQSDFVEMITYSKANYGYKYILIVIDVYSKYVWAKLLKNKNGIEIITNFEQI